jgi:hypothetical protein
MCSSAAAADDGNCMMMEIARGMGWGRMESFEIGVG